MTLRSAILSVFLMTCATSAFAGFQYDASHDVIVGLRCQTELGERLAQKDRVQQEREAEERARQIKPSAMPEDFFPGQGNTPNWGETPDPYNYPSVHEGFPGR